LVLGFDKIKTFWLEKVLSGVLIEINLPERAPKQKSPPEEGLLSIKLNIDLIALFYQLK